MFSGKITDVFFDLDHTLWDFERNSALTFQRIFQKQGLDLDLNLFLEHYIPINLMFWKLYREEKVGQKELRYQRLKRSFDAMGIEVEDTVINTLSHDYINNLSSFTHVLPGTFEILDYLKGSYRLHIITNGFSETQERKMTNAKIRSYFDVIMNSEIAGVKKPNPKIFHLALKKAMVDSSKALMIGDNLEADILGALNVEMSTIHILTSLEERHNFSTIVQHLREIKNYL